MPEDVNMDVAEVVQPTETETVQDIHESIEPQKGSAEYNFREARRIMDQQSREINELKYHLQLNIYFILLMVLHLQVQVKQILAIHIFLLMVVLLHQFHIMQVQIFIHLFQMLIVKVD